MLKKAVEKCAVCIGRIYKSAAHFQAIAQDTYVR